MGLESATFISSLVSANPPGTDLKRQGDDHIRLVKAALQSTFPNADKAFYFPDMLVKTANYTITAAQQNVTFMVDTAAGVVTGTLPTLGSSDDGWVCHFIKTNTGTNAHYVAPASGTLQSGEASGLAKCRRVIPGARSTAIWSGTAWYVTRVPGHPIGAIIDHGVNALPVGYEYPNGQTLNTTNYPEYAAVNGASGVTVDMAGRVAAGLDNLGAGAAGLLTSDPNGFGTGGTFGAAGGAQKVSLVRAHLPNESLDIQTNAGGSHVHGGGGLYDAQSATLLQFQAGASSQTVITAVNASGSESTDANVPSTMTGFTSTLSGGVAQAGHNTVQPTRCLPKILVVE